MPSLVDITITTRKPKKWLVVDTDSNEVYRHDFHYASKKQIKKMIKSLKQELKK